MNMHKITVLLVIWLAMLAGPVVSSFASQSDDVQVEVVGHGSDRQDAVFDALAEAVRQVHGVEIHSRQNLTRSSQELAITDAEGARSSLTLSADQSGEVTVGTEGYISGYRILSATPRDHDFTVRLRVTLPVYRVPGKETHETRRTLAIYPFEAESGLWLLGEPVAAYRAASRMTQAVIRSVTQTRRFAVVERGRTEAILQERRLLADPSVPAREKARLGVTLGADYVLIGRMTGLDIDASERISSLTGESSIEVEGSIVIDLRIMSPATRQVLWADTVVVSAERALAGTASTSGMAAFEQIIWDRAADAVAERAVSAIYPLRLIDFNGDRIVLNQGGSQLREGMALQIFSLGEEMFDPYSGESLGRKESSVATARVERVTDRVSYATITGGRVESADPAAYLARRTDLEELRSRQNEAARRGTRRTTVLPQDGQ